MRLDKFLKVSRILKRRTVANAAADAGRVCVNGKPAKPAHRLKEGDFVEISFGSKKLTVVVKQLSEHIKAAQAQDMYEVQSED